jgi:4-amino-4-deoxy-L-arabinose transferase-like glycosyltransferase
MRVHRFWTAALGGGLLLVAVLYLSKLNQSPPSMSIEELENGRQAISIASTGRSLSGQFLPLYLGEPGFTAGRDPVWIYLDAALLKAFPFSEALLRVPSALAGILDVVLMFILAERLFGSRAYATIAASLLALTPAHFLESRLAIQQIGPVGFVLAWLILLLKFLETDRRSLLFWACAVLGLGIYTYLSVLVMAPVYFAATILALGPRRRQLWPAAFAGFGLSLVPYVTWTLLHPGRMGELTTYYSANGYNQDLAERHISLLTIVVRRIDMWWNAFSPERLFLVGDSNFRFSTRRIGYFLTPVAPFLLVGIFTLRRILKPPVPLLVYVGLLLAPLPVLVTGDFEVKRWLAFVVFVVVATTVGVRVAWDSRSRLARAATVGAAVICALQFTQFLRDYHGDYHARAADLLGNNARGAVQQILATTDDLSCVYFDKRTGAVDRYWQFYAQIYGHAEFAERGHVVDSEREDFAAPRSCSDAALVVLNKELRNHDAYAARLRGAGWTSTPIPEENGRIVFSVMRWQNSGGTR